MTDKTTDAVRIAGLELEVRIRAKREDVWRALTADIARWWPTAFYCSGGESPTIALDARPGGHMVETSGDGDGLVWGTVVHVKRGEVLQLTGVTGAAWGGPNAWYGGYELREDGGETVLRFSESTFGRVSGDNVASKEKGWKFLLDGCLRAHLEGGEPPEWRD